MTEPRLWAVDTIQRHNLFAHHDLHMETWRFLASMTILLVVYGIVVTALGDPPSPLQFALAAVFAVVGLYVSDKLVQRTVDEEE